MKFADGFWAIKPGYDVKYATQICEVTAGENYIDVIATSSWIENRGMTLGGPIFRIRYTSTMENTIKVTVRHYGGRLKKLPSFELNERTDFKPTIIEHEDTYDLFSGDTAVVIPKNGNWNIEYYYKDRLLTKQGWRTTSYISEEKWKTDERTAANAMHKFFDRRETSCGSFMHDMMNIEAGECIYGFGEKFTPFVKNGQTVDIWNNDGGTATEQTYKSIPFHVSSNGYGLFVNHPEKVSFEIASETVSKAAFSVQGEQLEYFVIGGANISNVISTYTLLAGRPALPPAYTFGLWLTTSFTTSYDEATVTSFIDVMAERDIPLEVFHFDCFWMKEFHWCNFEWDKEMFPDPKAMLERLKAKGLEICVWINPYIAELSALFDEGAAWLSCKDCRR